MRRAWWVAVVWIAIAGCGRSGARARSGDLSFESLSDTAGLAQGAPILDAIEPYRLPNGLVRVRGRVQLPDGTRLQISIVRKADHVMVSRLQVLIAQQRFDSPPVLGERGPIPQGDYAFELRAEFNDVWQSPAVMAATRGGRDLRGPGMTRDRAGEPVFVLTRDGRL
jgi:hypothetical protein